MKQCPLGHVPKIQIEYEDAASEHDDASGMAVIARIAVLEGVDAADAQDAIAVPPEADALDGNGVVEQQQILRTAGGPGRRHRHLARLEAVVPEPAAGRQQQKSEKIKQIHARSLAEFLLVLS